MGVRLDVGVAQAIGHDKSYRLLVTLIGKMGPGVDSGVHFAGCIRCGKHP
jgi:hypothetical protein